MPKYLGKEITKYFKKFKYIKYFYCSPNNMHFNLAFYNLFDLQMISR